MPTLAIMGTLRDVIEAVGKNLRQHVSHRRKPWNGKACLNGCNVTRDDGDNKRLEEPYPGIMGLRAINAVKHEFGSVQQPLTTHRNEVHDENTRIENAAEHYLKDAQYANSTLKKESEQRLKDAHGEHSKLKREAEQYWGGAQHENNKIDKGSGTLGARST